MSFRIKNALVVSLVAFAGYVSAMSWRDWWVTPDQQGAQAMQQQDYAKAAQYFRDPMWAGSAAYRAGDYQTAAQKFAGVHTAEGYYNLGNALARQMKLSEAIKAYDKALHYEPTHQDAAFNRALLAKLMQQNNRKEDAASKQNQQEKDSSSDKTNESKSSSSPKNQQKNTNKSTPQNNDNQDANKPAKTSEKQKNKGADMKKNNTTSQTQKSPSSSSEPAKTQEDQKMAASKQEEQHAKQQWLQLVPDEPGGLMREKFLQEHLRRQRSFE